MVYGLVAGSAIGARGGGQLPYSGEVMVERSMAHAQLYKGTGMSAGEWVC